MQIIGNETHWTSMSTCLGPCIGKTKFTTTKILVRQDNDIVQLFVGTNKLVFNSIDFAVA